MSADGKPAPTTGLKELLDAANEAAKREATQWFYLVTVMVYLAAAVGSVTHRKLFLAEPVTLPIFNVALPLTGFFVVAPTIFVILHFYSLAQLRVMARKMEAALTEAARVGEPLDAVMLRLDSFALAQMLAGRHLGRRSIAPVAMAWITLIIAPVILLLFFQIRFLPYQDAAVTWVHRVLLGVDLALLWWLWPWPKRTRVEDGGRVSVRWDLRLRVVVTRCLAALLMGIAAFFSLVLATIPGELADGLADHVRLAVFRENLFDGEPDRITLRPTTVFSRVLVLPGERLISDKDFETLARASDRRAGASDLRRADLSGANLQDAQLADAWLQGATLDGAQMQGALVTDAWMEGASLRGAQLQGATLSRVYAQGAALDSARLQGASLDSARLQGASLVDAQMQGASLVDAQMQGASLSRAYAQGAALNRAKLQGSSLDNVQLQGATLDHAQMQGASLDSSAVWRLDGRNAALDGAGLAGLSFSSSPPPSETGPMMWEDWIARWVASVPEGYGREAVRERLQVLLAAEDTAAQRETEQRFRAGGAPAPQEVLAALITLGCAEANAPFVARGVLRQLTGRYSLRSLTLGDYRKDLARAFLPPAPGMDACPGARGLDAQEQSLIRAIAEGRRSDAVDDRP